jgi:transglutaminase-like putative cysteine protease
MKKTLILIWIALTAGLAAAQINPEAELIRHPDLLAAAAQPVAEHPESDIILLEDLTRVRYEPDGSYRYLSDMAVKILTEKGRQEESNIRTGYNAAYGTARFVRAEIIKPDGRMIEINLAEQSREAIDQSQMNMNIFDPSHKTIQLTVPDLNVGDVLRYTVAGERTKTVVPNTWSDYITLEGPYPIRRLVYELDAPAALPLERIELRDEIPGTVTFSKTEQDGRILYRWEAANVPRMYDEPDMPARHTVVQRLLLSTIPDWESLSEWYWTLSEPRLEAVTDAMKQKVRDLVDGLDSRQEKIDAIFRFVSQDVRYMGITVEDEAPGYEPHDVSLTFNNRYGVCRDKAALLVTMLRLAGFDARPVLIYVGPKKDPDVPTPWFNHAITAVREDNGRWLLMDATNENTRDLLPAYLSDCSYLVATPDGDTLRTSPVTPPKKNLLSIEIDGALDDRRRIAATAELRFDGINDTAYRGRLARLKPEERRPYFEERLQQALGNARLLDLEIRPAEIRNTTVPLSVRMEFEVENALAAGADEALLQVPALLNRFGLFSALLGEGIGLDKRNYPLQVQATCGVTETVRLDLNSSGFQPSALPEYDLIDTPDLLIRRTVGTTNGQLTATADLMLRTVEFSPEEYLRLKENLKLSERNARKRILLERTLFPPDADLAVLEEEVVYTLFDEHNWKEERTVKQKVLTYAGKKEASDLKISFNPALERVVLNSATVTAVDGTVHQIDPQSEVNLMDSVWAGEVPRYPAGKILVASLPGVDLGSTIETRVTRMHLNRPFFSARESFAGHDPIYFKTVEVQAPHTIRINIGNPNHSLIRQRIGHRNERAVYTWSCGRQDAVKKERHLPPPWVTAPTLMLSAGDPQEYTNELNDRLTRAAQANKTVARKARELTAGLKTRLEKITALRDFADRAVREAGPALPDLPLDAITPADRVLAEGCGNAADRAVLLSALLDAAKLKPRFLLSSRLPRVESLAAPAQSVFQRDLFDAPLIAVKGDDKETDLYLGDSGQYARPGTLARAGIPAIDLKSGQPESPKTAWPDSTDSLFILNLAENGDVDIRHNTLFSGTHLEAVRKRFDQFTPEERRREHQRLLSSLSQSAEPSGNLKTDFVDKGLLSFAARLPGYAVRQNDRLYLTLPGGLDDPFGLQSGERENPFYIPDEIRRTTVRDILLPAGWELLLAPKNVRVELPANAGTISLESVASPGKLTVIQRVEIRPALIPAKDYGTLREAVRQLTRPEANALLLRKP